MGIKDKIKELLNRNDRVSELVKERRIQQKAEQRDKNSNERELERFYEEERQSEIKRQLEQFRKKRQYEDNHINRIKQKYMFHDDKPILKQKNIFSMDKGNMLNNNMGFWK